MSVWQNVLLIIFGVISVICAMTGLKQSKTGNTNALTPYLFFMGAFVWADAVIFGLFWLLIVLISLISQSILFFLLIYSVFWLVRSFGETIYWFNQQFSPLVRNKPEDLPLFKFFPSDSVWFVYQIIWQCVLVLAIISTVYLFKLWL